MGGLAPQPCKFHTMIYLTRLNGNRFVLNAEIIREVEATPDTIVTLSTGQKIMVAESVDEVVQEVLEYKRAIALGGSKPAGGSE